MIITFNLKSNTDQLENIINRLVVCLNIVICMAGSVRSQDAAKFSDVYVRNREPLVQEPFLELPLGAIRPEGWFNKAPVIWVTLIMTQRL